jgi:acyl CoA:acetate/3-ketoacid CoA transferase alpha subunit
LLNVSTRGAVNDGDGVMIGGFIVSGVPAKQVVVRAIGPSLAETGVTGFLADPELELYDSTGAW